MENVDFKKYWLIIVSLGLVFFAAHAQSGAWKKKTDLPTPRVGASACVINDKIYVLGGTTDALIYTDLAFNEVYNPTTDSWEEKEPLPTPRGFLSTAVVDGIIYAVGGGYSTSTKKVEAYDPVSDTWATKANMLGARLGAQAAIVDGIIYNIGGNYSSRNCEAYDPKTNAWTKKTDMPEAGGALAVTVYNGLIYAFGGGFYGQVSTYGTFSTVYAYNPRTDIWTKKKDMPTPRFGLQTYLIDGKIYAIGGSQEQNTALATVEVYDPVNDTWETEANMPNNLAWSAGAVVIGKIYVIGGTSNWATGTLEVWEYDIYPKDGWIRQSSLSIVNTLEEVCFTDENNGTAVGYGGTILRTEDGGSNWVSQLSDTTVLLYGVSFTDASTGTAVGYDGSGAGIILRTTDGGNHWVSQYNGTGYLNAVSLTDANTGTVVGGNGIILRTTDGGEHWVSQSSETTQGLYDVCFIDVNNGTTVGCDGTILRTTDGGNHWVSQIGGTTSWLGVSFTDPNTGTVVGLGDTILRTTDGGDHWFSQSSGTTSGICLYDVCFTDRKNGTAVGWDWNTNLGIILRTTDGGNHWVSQSSGSVGQLHGVCFIDQNIGTVVGEMGTILRTTTGGVTSIREEQHNEVPKDYLLYQNYPNPFNPTTVISYQLAAGSQITLKVYDVLGNEVVTLVNDEKPRGSYTITWNTERLSSGVYFYQLKAGNYVQTKKMILLR